MSVYFDRRDRLWRVQVQKHGRRLSTTARTREDAQLLEAKVRRDLFLSRLGERPARTVEDAIERWLELEVPKLVSHKATESHARALIGFVEKRPLEEIAEAWADYRKGNPTLTNSTLNRRGAILRRVGNLAFTWGWTDVPLGKKIQLLPENAARHVYLTPAQVRKLVAACKPTPAPDYLDAPARAAWKAHAARTARAGRDAIAFAAWAGLRLSEIMRLAPAHVRSSLITLGVTKSGRPRVVPLHAELRAAVKRLPIPVGWRWILRQFERARAAAGLGHVRFHDLRHTNASWLIQSGADPVTVRDLLGHSSLAVTSRYSHLAVKHLRKAVRAIK